MRQKLFYSERNVQENGSLYCYCIKRKAKKWRVEKGLGVLTKMNEIPFDFLKYF